MNSLARNIIRTFSTQVGSQLIAIAVGIVVARELGPSGKGFMSYAAAGVSFISVFFYGFTDAILYQFGKLGYSARSVHAVAIRVLAAVLAITIPIFVAIAIFIPSQRPLAATAAVIPFAMYIQLMTPFFLVTDNLSSVNKRTLIQSFGTAICTIPLLLYFHVGLAIAILVWISFYVVGAVQAAVAMRPVLVSAQSEPLRMKLAIEQWRFGIRAAGGSVAGFLNMRVSTLIVSIMLSSAALGWYTLAIGTGELLWQVSRAFAWSALGRIGSDSLADSAALVARITRNTLAIVASIGTVAFIAGPWLIVHVYGERFAPAGAALRWALPGLIAYAAEVALTKFIVLQLARPLTTMWIQTGAAVLCAVLTITSASQFGIVAAAAATSVTYLVVTVVLIGIFVDETNVPLERLLVIQRDDFRHYSNLFNGMLRTLKLRSA